MLTPINAKVFLTYICPNCYLEIDVSHREAISIGKVICYGCENLLILRPIEIVKVTPMYLDESSIPKNRKSNEPALTNLQKTAIIALTQRGFPKKETAEFVSSHSFQSIEDYIQGAIRKGLE